MPELIKVMHRLLKIACVREASYEADRAFYFVTEMMIMLEIISRRQLYMVFREHQLFG